ncbi:MAG: type IV pilus twitching motility protein PilT [Planctomycetota bacterium]|jgi:twitching motility protein PilT
MAIIIEQQPEPDPQIKKLLEMMAKHNATDLHLKSFSPPIFRIGGLPRRMESPKLPPEDVEKLVRSMMTDHQQNTFTDKGTLDFAVGIPGVGRYRVNVYRQRGTASAAIRRVRFDIPKVEELHLPEGVKKLADFRMGLCLCAGITGSGKSTTLASILNLINHTRRCHILTLEDPIEYLYRDEKAFVNQREVGIDVDSFSTALKYMVREDPDVILIGEMRDMETLETALISAETGHLVFGTVHSGSAAQTIGRVLDFFPYHRHDQIRQLLYFVLKAVMVQMLLRSSRKDISVVPALELMIVNPAIRKLIREGDDEKIMDVIRSSKHDGMQDMNQSLVSLVKQKLIAQEVALEFSPNPEALSMNLKGIYLGQDRGTITG